MREKYGEYAGCDKPNERVKWGRRPILPTVADSAAAGVNYAERHNAKRYNTAMYIKNPFCYGRVVAGPDFTDREKETGELSAILRDCGRVFVISPRRYGKTSLILNVLEKLRGRGVLTAYLDMYDVTTLEQFASHYARALAKASESKVEELIRFIRDVIPGLRPQVSISPEGDISVALDVAVRKRDMSLVLKDLFEVPEKIARKKGKNFAVFFDEFQEVSTLGGDALEKLMRSCLQHQSRVGYLFSGSKQHLMSDMVSDRNRAFYKMGSAYYLDKIPGPEFKKFIEGKFGATGRRLSPEVIPAIMRVSRGIPYYVQHLCYEIWNQNPAGTLIRKEAVPFAVERIVAGESHVYLTIWDSLALSQRHLLQAIAVNGGQNVFSQEFIGINRLGAVASVQKSLKLLLKKNIIEKENGSIFFPDIWLEEWVKRRSA